jgi:hypothetical protein
MQAIRFEFIALTILIGWISAAASTLSMLSGMPVIPADAPVFIANEVVVQQHASIDVAPTHLAMLIDVR